MASHSSEHQAEHHIVPVKYYIRVFILLMVFTALTVFVASKDWGQFNIVVALTIAVIKATAVVLIFMHVLWSSRLTQVIVVAGIFWLLILLAITMSDYAARTGWPTKLGQVEITAPQ